MAPQPRTLKMLSSDTMQATATSVYTVFSAPLALRDNNSAAQPTDVLSLPDVRMMGLLLSASQSSIGESRVSPIPWIQMESSASPSAAQAELCPHAPSTPLPVRCASLAPL